MRRILTTLVGAVCVLQANAAWQEYNETLSKSLFFYTAACYCEVETVANWSCGAACANNTGVQDVRLASDYLEGTFAYAAYNSLTNAIVVAFRGSHNYINGLFDIDFYLVPFTDGPEGAQVHTGFLDSYLGLQTQVISGVAELLAKYPQTEEIHVVGHSLGGAMATLGALDLKKKLLPKQPFKFYTFGAPRVGNEAFSDYVFSVFPDGGYHRIVH